MKKHIIVTIVLLLCMSGVLVVFLLSRSSTGHEEAPVTSAHAGIGSDAAEREDVSQKTDSSAMGNEQETMVEEPESESTENEATQPKQDASVKMFFTGDVLFANSFAACYGSGGIDAVVSPELMQQMTEADLTMVNEEFPFSTRGVPMEDKQYTFRADPSYVTALNELGVDIVSLANNHILDYGKEALSDTFTTLDQAGIRYAGAGESAERAKELQAFEINGKKIGILAASRVIPVEGWNVENQTPGVFTTYDATALCAEIEKAKKACEYVVVFVHWGVEYEAYPEDYQRSLAKSYIDAGADLVIGAHTHCLQGIEYYKNRMICYSLGNFVFGSQIDRSAAVEITLSADGRETDRLIPVYASGGCTRQMENTDAQALYQYMQSISDGITVSEDGCVTEQESGLE